MKEVEQKLLPHWEVSKLEVDNKKFRFDSLLKYSISEMKDFQYFAISRDRKRVYVSLIK